MKTSYNCFKVLTDSQYYIIQMTVDTSNWKWMPVEIAQNIEKAKKEAKDAGLKPAPFGYEFN